MHVSYEIRLMIKISVDFFPGHYIYIEASSPRKPGDNAMLVSAQQPTPTSDQCFEFWYSMYGAETGTLNLYIEHGNQLGSPVWTKQGELNFILAFSDIQPLTTLCILTPLLLFYVTLECSL